MPARANDIPVDDRDVMKEIRVEGRVGRTISGASLNELFVAMRSSDELLADAAWAECFRQYNRKVWARVYYVLRTVSWLKEPDQAAEDVTSQVFLGLPHALRNYRDFGRPEQWLLNVASRTAFRHRESLTGNWSSKSRDKGSAGQPAKRVQVDFDQIGELISNVAAETEMDERLELQRRLEAWRVDPEKERWLGLVDLFLQGYGHDEIAEKLGITAGTSRTLLWKIRQELGRVHAPAPLAEVVGRDAHWRFNVIPHPTSDELEAFADLLLDDDLAATVAAHLDGCAQCLHAVVELRRGFAILALASDPPDGMFERILQRRRAGEIPLLPTFQEDEADLPEVVGFESGDPSDTIKKGDATE